MPHRMSQEQVIGAMLGMAIGDALGMPFRGMTSEEIARSVGRVETFQSFTFEDGAELAAGEFSGASEAVLCIIESFTTNNGEFDTENILARLQMLAAGESRRWMDPSTRFALEAMEESGGDNGHPFAMATGDVAARGIPLGIVYAFAAEPENLLERDARKLAAMTHLDPVAAESIEVVATAVQIAGAHMVSNLEELPAAVASVLPNARLAQETAEIQANIDETDAKKRIAEVAGENESAEAAVMSALLLASGARDPIRPLIESVNLGGATSSRSALTGAIVGASMGASAIPQEWIDGLESRIYLLLAAPWFYRTIQFRFSPMRLNRTP